jgi:hypothetical protein
MDLIQRTQRGRGSEKIANYAGQVRAITKRVNEGFVAEWRREARGILPLLTRLCQQPAKTLKLLAPTPVLGRLRHFLGSIVGREATQCKSAVTITNSQTLSVATMVRSIFHRKRHLVADLPLVKIYLQ